MFRYSIDKILSDFYVTIVYFLNFPNYCFIQIILIFQQHILWKFFVSSLSMLENLLSLFHTNPFTILKINFKIFKLISGSTYLYPFPFCINNNHNHKQHLELFYMDTIAFPKMTIFTNLLLCLKSCFKDYFIIKKYYEETQMELRINEIFFLFLQKCTLKHECFGTSALLQACVCHSPCSHC